MGEQAWCLRRLISTYNAIARRPHIPREKELRRLFRSQGIDVPLEVDPKSRSRECLEDGEVEELEEEDEYGLEGGFEEGEESEAEEDPEVQVEAVANGHVALKDFCVLFFFKKKAATTSQYQTKSLQQTGASAYIIAI